MIFGKERGAEESRMGLNPLVQKTESFSSLRFLKCLRQILTIDKKGGAFVIKAVSK